MMGKNLSSNLIIRDKFYTWKWQQKAFIWCQIFFHILKEMRDTKEEDMELEDEVVKYDTYSSLIKKFVSILCLYFKLLFLCDFWASCTCIIYVTLSSIKSRSYFIHVSSISELRWLLWSEFIKLFKKSNLEARQRFKNAERKSRNAKT